MNRKKIIAVIIVFFTISFFSHSNTKACPCYSEISCSGGCWLGSCARAPLGNPAVGLPKCFFGWNSAGGNCGVCYKFGLPVGTCGPPFGSGPCPEL